MLVDSHCHLDFPEFAGELDQIVARATEQGVGLMVTIGTELSRFPGVCAVAERFPNIFCTVGVHPHEAETDWGYDPAILIAHAAHPKVVGIGETGLDYFYEQSPREAQIRSFRQHIEAARQTGLPLIVHTRDADPETIEILREEYREGAFPGLIHCFTSGPELADFALEIGFYISISGIATFKNAQGLRDTIARVPLDRLLVETDSPYLAPIPMRGKRNEPAFVRHTATALAALKGVDPTSLDAATTKNFFRLFKRIPRDLEPGAAL